MSGPALDLARLRGFAEEALRAKPAPLSSIGPCRLIRELGRGATGVVYEGEDVGLGRPVAVKVLHDSLRENRDAFLRFQREARSAAKLVHPNVVQIHGSGEDQDRAYLVMELVRGRSLKELLAKRGGDLRTLLGLLEQVARGAGAAHAAGIVHRDIKPANIIVDGDGRAKLGDFGLARWLDSDVTLTRSGVPIGTPMYMSPEQVRGETARIRPSSDVFSLGAILYQLLTGRPPHAGESTGEVYSKIVGEELASPRRFNAKVDADLETICLRALERVAERRYPDGSAFADDLRRYLEGAPIQSRPPSRIGRLWRRTMKHWNVMAIALTAVVVGGGLSGWAAAQGVGALRRLEQEAQQRESERRAAQKLLDSALPAIEKAGRLGYDARADVEAALAKVEEVRPLVEQALRRAPDLTTAHNLMGRTWEALGWTSKAEAAWREWIRLDPESGPAHFHLARLLAFRALDELLGKRPGAGALAEEAAAEIRSAIGSGSGFNDALQLDFVESVLALVRENPVEARRVCERAIAKHGRSEGAEDFLWLFAFIVPYEEKRAALESAVDLCPNHPWARFGLGIYHEQGGDLRRAVAEYGLALRANPRFVDALYNRGSCRYRLKDYDAAELDFDRILEIEPAHERALLSRAHARYVAEDWAGAVEDYSKELDRRPEEVKAWQYRGIARSKLGDVAGAVEDLVCYLAMAEPDDADRPSVERQLRRLREQLNSRRREF